MVITNIKDYLKILLEGETSERSLNFTEREIQFMKNIEIGVGKRDKGLVNNLNPSKNYCVVTVGSLHVPSAVNKLQKIGYKAQIFLTTKCTSMNVINYEKIKDELLEGFERTQYSEKESMVIADKHLMIYSLEGILQKPEELLKKNVKEISICLEHSKPGNEERFLFKNGKHCFHIYDELKDYAIKCRQNGVDLELIGLECREDGKEIC